MEKRLNQIDTNLENIQGMIDQIQVTKEQHAVVQALDKGNSALKELHKIMDPDTVQRLFLSLIMGRPWNYHYLNKHFENYFG